MCGKIKFITFKNPLSALASEVTIASGLNPLMLTRATNAPTISTAVPIPVILLRKSRFFTEWVKYINITEIIPQ